MKNREPCTPDLRYCFLQSETSRALDDTCLYKSSLVSRCEHKPKGWVSERKKETKKVEGKWIRWLSHQQATDLLWFPKDGNQSHIYRGFFGVLQVKLVRTRKTYLKKKKQRWVHICVSIVSKPQKSCALFACTRDKNKLGGRGKLLVHESTCI